VDDIPEERDEKADTSSGDAVGDAGSATTPADSGPGDHPDAGLPAPVAFDAGVPDTGVPDAGCRAALVGTPLEIDFGSREVGTQNFEATTITNTCDAAVRLYIGGTIPDDFGFTSSAGQSCPFSGELLASGDSCVLVVRFFPSEFFIGWDATFSVIATATDAVTDAFLVDLSIPVHGVAAPASGG
jgi:hypothetical protein